ncbi:MAG: DUF1501 domain-containing protein [Acidobacteria bacterium]|nr:DUF1501 domain-containing protein [Acidobacteriota bacterium]MCA1640474.1 DUF1501 domain-containing protein [Acidobacteriota bacterium]
MSQTRRDFLRSTGCAALGTGLLAAGIQEFGLVRAFADTNATDYKALVCVFMSGGNDGNNLVVPVDATRFAQYTGARQAAGLALPAPGQPGGLLPVNPASGGQYGLHPSLVEIQSLFSQSKAAVVCNAGPLVEPLTKAIYQNGTGKRPLQLFSHSDQVGQWMTSVSNDNSQTGWGGRTADRAATLNGAATFPQMVSIAGVNLFVTGQATRPLAIGDSNTPLASVLPLNNAVNAEGLTFTTAQNTARRTAFDQIRALVTSDTLPRAAADITTSALQTSAALGSANPTITTTFPNTSAGRQLLQIARLIALRDTLSMKRQIFFVSIGGFDTHNNQMAANGQSSLLTQLSQAVGAFYNATVELGIADKVTTFTLSDFGRTLQPAGAGAGVGSDHAWGNHHLVVGGAVRGGDFYGTFPTLALGGPDDTDTRGRWIPTTSVEQYAATLASWYGLSASDLPLVFPLIGRFNSPNLGFML